MRVDSWVGEQINRMIESFEISLPEQNLAYIANCVLEPSSNNGYSTQGTIYKIINLNRLARRSTLPGRSLTKSIKSGNRFGPSAITFEIKLLRGGQSWTN